MAKPQVERKIEKKKEKKAKVIERLEERIEKLEEKGKYGRAKELEDKLKEERRRRMGPEKK